MENNKFQYDSQHEPIVLSNYLMKTLLNTDYPGDSIALYCFYYNTAKWQRTNSIKSVTGYTAKGLRWTEERVRKIKSILKALKLIEDIVSRNDKNQVTGHYIKVNFIWSKANVERISHPKDFPDGGNSQTVEIPEGNALSPNNINSLSKSNINALSVGNLRAEAAENITISMFDNFWKYYPKKASKGSAQTSWNKICSKKANERPTWKEIRLAIFYQKKSDQWQDPQFIPHASTWLNNAKWLDDPAEMKNFKRTEDKFIPKPGFENMKNYSEGEILRVKWEK